jgi:hypothetical protein
VKVGSVSAARVADTAAITIPTISSRFIELDRAAKYMRAMP